MRIARDGIIARHSGIETELDRVETWFTGPLSYRLSKEPIDDYTKRGVPAYKAYENHPVSERRMLVIANLIRNGAQAWPIFIYEEDAFLLEGWHRIVAFHLLDLTEIEVLTVCRIPYDATDFRLDEMQMHRDGEWCVQAIWRGLCIGHLRICAEDQMPGNGRHSDNTFVLPGFRRKGAASRLYSEAEALLQEKGMRLVPSPQPSLSDDAFAFWRRLNPDAVKHDTRP